MICRITSLNFKISLKTFKTLPHNKAKGLYYVWIKLVELHGVLMSWNKHLVVFTSLVVYVFMLSLLNITYSFSWCTEASYTHIRSLHMVWYLLRWCLRCDVLWSTAAAQWRTTITLVTLSCYNVGQFTKVQRGRYFDQTGFRWWWILVLRLYKCEVFHNSRGSCW
jgi:hypothetical protein